MTRLAWAAPGERRFETGIDRGVLYPPGEDGVSWSGLVAVTESSSGGEPKPVYIDGIKRQNRSTSEDYSATLEAYTYPPEFERLDGTKQLRKGLFATRQRRRSFGLSYRTRIGTDLNSDAGYKLHLVYNVTAAPSERKMTTYGETPDASLFSWSLSAVPVMFNNTKPTAHLVIDSTRVEPEVLALVEAALYGSDANQPYLPTSVELFAMFDEALPEVPFVVGEPDANGIFTISGSDTAVRMLDGTHFQLNSQFVTDLQDGRYRATSGVDEVPDGPDIPFQVDDLGNGLFNVTGPDSMVSMIDATHFQLNAPTVVNNGDGSYDVSSA